MNINQLQRYAMKEYLLMKFIFMGVIAEYLINVHVDNLGSIFISENALIYQRTKEIEIHNHFLQECIEYSMVKVQMFCSEERLTELLKN